ncbi:hypothetical protein M569_16054 [Genlisea aurea]|uniref:U-box domain-containing protein n=1 Tax=Genlisea aurea TaxID=192259 RepID=S8DH95_9LAMI|nr:hypothetical protein M569_16054 [Genlisea aurea]
MRSGSHSLKLKTTTRPPLFSCGFFRQCTQSVLSPTTVNPPAAAAAAELEDSDSSSSSNTSQSFTQWRFPMGAADDQPKEVDGRMPPPPTARRAAEGNSRSLEENFHVAEIQFGSGSDSDRLRAIHLLERCLVPDPRSAADCPAGVMAGVVSCLREGGAAARRSASKVLLALSLAEENRRVAVEAGAVTAVVEALADAETAAAERSLAALELLCTTAEGAAEVRAHALSVPMMVQVMGKMEARGKEHALSVLGVIYGGSRSESESDVAVAPAEEVARAVMLALQGECSARGRRKGAQLLKTLQENGGLDLSEQCEMNG